MPNLANRNTVFNNAYLHRDLYEKNEDVIDAIITRTEEENMTQMDNDSFPLVIYHCCFF
jgi:hypothetical protein